MQMMMIIQTCTIQNGFKVFNFTSRDTDKHGILYDNVSTSVYLLQARVTPKWFKLSQFALYHTREQCL